MTTQTQHTQAGEPSPIAYGFESRGQIMDVITPEEHDREPGRYNVPLITLQSHREAIASLQADRQKPSRYGHDTYYREIITKLEREIRALHLARGTSGAKRDAEAAELRAALVGCEKDAARYRFIRDANRSDVIAFELRHYAMETLDEYVDAAMDGEQDAAITQAQEHIK